jgi:hypothetical protein
MMAENIYAFIENKKHANPRTFSSNNVSISDSVLLFAALLSDKHHSEDLSGYK